MVKLKEIYLFKERFRGSFLLGVFYNLDCAFEVSSLLRRRLVRRINVKYLE